MNAANVIEQVPIHTDDHGVVHKPDVDAYLKERAALAERVREEAERRFPPAGIRERLLARRK